VPTKLPLTLKLPLITTSPIKITLLPVMPITLLPVMIYLLFHIATCGASPLPLIGLKYSMSAPYVTSKLISLL
jgi:hypothetical protein